MELEKINKILRDEAITHGLCQDWQNNVWNRQMTGDELAELYFRGSDFAIEHHYPSNDEIKSLFNKDFLRKHNILVDDNWSLLNPRYAMILGSTCTTIRVNGHNVSQIYIRDNSKVKLIAKHHSTTIISTYENAEVEIEKDNTASVKIIHGSK